MHLIRLELEEFRGYRHLDLQFSAHGLRIVGRNASGKSTLLEAIAMLSTTRSPRSSSERDVINWVSGQDIGVPPFARLIAAVATQVGPIGVEISLEGDPQRPGIVRKRIKLGGRVVRAMDAVGVLKTVLFSPEDIILVTGPPAERRRYLDVMVSQLDGAYLRALSRYQRILTNRNSLLKTLSKERISPDAGKVTGQLRFWDEELVATGSVIVAERMSAVNRLAGYAGRRFHWLSEGETLEVAYRPSVSISHRDHENRDTARDRVMRDFETALQAARPDEVRRGMTLVGPHRDDLDFKVAGVDLAAFGSRGQQRVTVVALKLAEVDLMEQAAGEPPILLLDDVMSELDHRHQSLLIETAAGIGAQVLVTATDAALLDRPDLANLPQVIVDRAMIR